MNLANKIAIVGMAGIAALTIACGAGSPPAYNHTPEQTVSSDADSIEFTDINSYVQELFNLVNQYRIENHLPSLEESAKLTNVAKWMTDDMATNNYFSHTDSLGRNPFARMDSFGYYYNTWRGENLGAGFPDPETVFLGFKSSPKHNANMLNPNYTSIGLAVVYDFNSYYKWYWAQEFGGEQDIPTYSVINH